MRSVLVTWRADGAERRGVLTVEHAASSYGLPVVVEAGRTRRALGAAEVGELSLTAPVTAATRDVVLGARRAGYTVREPDAPPGRPVSVGAEVAYTLRAPGELLDEMRRRAADAGITASEAWRRAARAWLDGRR